MDVEFEGRERILSISLEVVKRLWERYWQEIAKRPLQLSLVEVVTFEVELRRNLRRKYSIYCKSRAGVIDPKWYTCWRKTSHVAVEMFADCVNESGILPRYCSLFPEDQKFGSVGKWEDTEDSTAGGVACPPFEVKLVRTIVEKFDDAVSKARPYCRILLLPLDFPIVKNRMQSRSFRGELLAELRGVKCFRARSLLHAFAPLKYEYYHWADLGVFIWVNREYHCQNPPARDIETTYLKCIGATCKSPSSSKIHRDSFKRAFPQELRC